LRNCYENGRRPKQISGDCQADLDPPPVPEPEPKPEMTDAETNTEAAAEPITSANDSFLMRDHMTHTMNGNSPEIIPTILPTPIPAELRKIRSEKSDWKIKKKFLVVF